MSIKNKISGIYAVECVKNKKVYIGQSININTRISKHKFSLKKNCHSNRLLQEDYNKYGVDNFDYFLLEICDKEQFDEKERYWLEQFSDKYNLTTGGVIGNKYHELARKKLSESHMGISNGEHSEETKRKISEAQLGEKNHMYGKKHTDEARKKMSKIQTGNTNCLGHKLTEEHKQKISEGNKGKKKVFTEEHKKNIGLAQKNIPHKPHTEKTKQALREMRIGEKNPMYGKRYTDEEKKKMSIRMSGEKNGNFKKETQEMIDDFKNGMSRKVWTQKYNTSQTVWDRIKKTY